MKPARVFDAIVLAGGSSRRFGGGDKALVLFGGRSFLAHALSAVDAARTTVVVGPPRAGYERATWVEEGAETGPVGALRAGITVVDAEVVVVLAVDMPLVRGVDVRGLVDALAAGDCDGVALAPVAGAPQFLAGAYRRDPLERRLREVTPESARLRDVMSGLRVQELISESALDCDSPEELLKLEERSASRS